MINYLKIFVKKFFFLLNFLAAIYALFVIELAYHADIKHWIAGFLGLTVPFAIVLNIFFFVSYLLSTSWKAVISFLVLLVAYPLLNRTIRFKFGKADLVRNESAFSVLSYNVMYLDAAKFHTDGEDSESRQIINDLTSIDADIKCVQELYNKDGHPVLNSIKKIRIKNPYYVYLESEKKRKNNQSGVGLSIFSKYPIVNSMEVPFGVNNNGFLIADIATPKGTIRVINVQLRSMGIRVAKALTADENVRNKEARNILSQLKYGFTDRGLQVNQLEDFLQNSPYPVILAGDFNELPYGFAYGKASKYLANAFEKKGSGFGFTYHKLPSFLRIDNIFFSQETFEISDFNTYKIMDGSDHYPIKADLYFK